MLTFLYLFILTEKMSCCSPLPYTEDQIGREFFTSENEMILTYWYKCSSGFEIHTSDPHIQRIVPISASFEEIGHAILSIYEEAGII